MAITVIAMLTVLAMVSCAGDGATVTPAEGTTGTATPHLAPTFDAGSEFEYPAGDDDLVLLIDEAREIQGMSISVLDLPWLAVYGDGRVITQGPIIAIYPPPALPNLQEARLSSDGVQALLRAAYDAGLLDGDADYRRSTAPDATTTTFVVTAGGTTTRVSVYALDDEDLPDDTSPEELEARASLRMFWQQVVDYRSTVPEGSVVQDERAFDVERLQLVVVPATNPLVPPDPSISPDSSEWPLDTPAAEFGETMSDLPDARCGVVEGDDLELVLTAMQSANLMTEWESDGRTFAVYPRPLLPHEAGCVLGA